MAQSATATIMLCNKTAYNRGMFFPLPCLCVCVYISWRASEYSWSWDHLAPGCKLNSGLFRGVHSGALRKDEAPI